MTDHERAGDLPVLAEQTASDKIHLDNHLHAKDDTTVTVTEMENREPDRPMAEGEVNNVAMDETDTASVDMTGIDNRAAFLETYFAYMQRKWKGALTYGTLDQEKKWKVLTNENGYLLEMRTFAGFHDLIYLTDELKEALRQLATQEVGIEIRVGTEEFRYRLA